MPQGGFLETAGPLLTVLTPLVAVPLTVITFYLRALREAQTSFQADLSRRVDALDAASQALHRRLTQFERDYATKEEWLRECMHSRGRLEQLAASAVRLESAVEHLQDDRHDTRPTSLPAPRSSAPASPEDLDSPGAARPPLE